MVRGEEEIRFVVDTNAAIHSLCFQLLSGVAGMVK